MYRPRLYSQEDTFLGKGSSVLHLVCHRHCRRLLFRQLWCDAQPFYVDACRRNQQQRGEQLHRSLPLCRCHLQQCGLGTSAHPCADTHSLPSFPPFHVESQRLAHLLLSSALSLVVHPQGEPVQGGSSILGSALHGLIHLECLRILAEQGRHPQIDVLQDHR